MAVLAMRQNRSDILVELAHLVKDMFQFKPQEHLKTSAFRELLGFFDRLYTTPPPDIKLLKSIILKVTPEVIELLAEAFRMDD